jgi:4-hydroxybenzoate polyprenyltransferase
VAFSSVASAAYIINDLLDLQSDRLHPTKRRRPWASGALPLVDGMRLVPALLALGFGLAAISGVGFLLAILGYFAVTLAYSLVLKRLPVVDVMTLAGLYMARVLAGGIVIGLTLSEFLLGFCLFFFMCLALVKRHTELQRSVQAGFGNPRRGYRTSDLPFVFTSAVASGYCAVIVLALYVTSPNVAKLYDKPEGVWAACVVVLLWINRTLLLAHRGEMHDDPIVFALRDRASYVMIAVVVVLVAASSW